MNNEKSKQELYPKNGEVTFLMPNTNTIAKLKTAEVGANITASYRTKEEWVELKGKPQKCFFLGMKEAVDENDKVYYLAKLHDGKSPFVAGQTVLVQSLASVPVGQGVQITCTGLSGSGSRKIAMFEVAQLGINLFDNQDEG
ncbi:MAG: hypothetical protein QQN55_00960 [Nitrosopumilus sp.]